MKLEEWKDTDRLINYYRLEITDLDLMHMEILPHDRMFLKECNGSNLVSDKLLALELMAKRIEEFKAGREKKHEEQECEA